MSQIATSNETTYALNFLKQTLIGIELNGDAVIERRDAPLIKAAIEEMEGAKING